MKENWSESFTVTHMTYRNQTYEKWECFFYYDAFW